MSEAGKGRCLVLVRHGRTAWNLIDRAQGHTDVPLDTVGHVQAGHAARRLAAMRPSRLWSSDLTRATQTAAHVAEATGLDLVTDDRLREYDLGARSGLTKPEFAERFPQEYAAWSDGNELVLVPGEETSSQVGARVTAALEDCWIALSPGESGVVVLHGACLMVGLIGFLQWPPELVHGLRGLDNCGWAIVNEHPIRGNRRLAAYNQTASGAAHGGPDFAPDGPIG